MILSNVAAGSAPWLRPHPLCLASAAAFGTMGVFGKLAYDEGASVGTLLATRFVLAAALFWLLMVCAGGARELMTSRAGTSARPRARGGRVRRSGRCLLRRARAPRRVAALASRLHLPRDSHGRRHPIGRERASRRTAVALALASTGLVLVLAGAAGALDPVGTLLGLGAAVVYSVYILSSEGVARGSRRAL